MVFRLILGYTWDDLSDVLNSKLGVALSKEKIRQIEQAERLDDARGKLPEGALDALAEAIDGIVCGRLMALPPDLDADRFRTRRQKLDTKNGWVSVAGCVEGGVTFGELLYERYTGRPFAYVRDALSEKKGDILEDALERRLAQKCSHEMASGCDRVGIPNSFREAWSGGWIFALEKGVGTVLW